jgi:hypothetical protein
MKTINKFLVILALTAFVLSTGAYALSRVTVTRTLPISTSPESTFIVSLSMNVDEANAPFTVGVSDNYPAGSSVSDISHGGIDKNGRIEWLFWSMGYPVEDRNMTYTVHVPLSANGTYWFNGTVETGTEMGAIEGDDWLVVLPYRITVTRDLPSIAYTDYNITVILNLDVTEAKKPNTLGLLEYFPAGWEVSNISYGGIKSNTSIEWFFSTLTTEVQDLNITYTLTVPSTANGTYNFSGEYNYSSSSYDVSDMVTGDLHLQALDRCELYGDLPPCNQISIPEVVDVITQWTTGEATLLDVIAMINAWANSL